MKCQKHLFSLKENVHYLDCAKKAPLLKSSEAQAIKSLVRERNPYEIGTDDFFQDADELRTQFGAKIHALPQDIAIIPSVSFGMASAFNNVPYRTGQHGITVEDEFPSGYFALKKWCNQHNAELKTIDPNGGDWNERIVESIDEHTAVVVLSSIHWISGYQFDLKKIGTKCKEVGAIFIVDGTQSVGAVPMTVHEFHIDALICAGYKWLLGPYSIGLAFFGETFQMGTPIEESWMNRKNARSFAKLCDYEAHYFDGAGRYNVGESSNFILVPMLNNSLRQLAKWPEQAIQDYCQNLGAPLFSYLKNVGVPGLEHRNTAHHLFALPMPEGLSMPVLQNNLLKNNIHVSVRGSGLRVALHLFNTEEDISKLIETIDNTLSQTS